jgi:pimeloyl-ACP methyl ester carboxylesterase
LATTSARGAASTASGEHREETRSVGGLKLQVLSGGRGDPVVVLHDYEYYNEWRPYQAALAADYSVLAPSHPGYGASEFPPHFDSIDDLVYVYLDLLRALGPAPVHLIGMGVGGWIAAELAVRCTHHLRRLVLVDPVGIKVGGRTDRDIADTFIVGPREFLELAWHDPEAGAAQMKLAGLTTLDEPTLVTVLRNRQTTAILTWRPFMHNPALRRRLARIDVPTLVLWGESDRIVSTDYGRAYAASIPGARFQSIPAAGHYPYLEQPEAFVAAVTAFLREQ